MKAAAAVAAAVAKSAEAEAAHAAAARGRGDLENISTRPTLGRALLLFLLLLLLVLLLVLVLLLLLLRTSVCEFILKVSHPLILVYGLFSSTLLRGASAERADAVALAAQIAAAAADARVATLHRDPTCGFWDVPAARDGWKFTRGSLTMQELEMELGDGGMPEALVAHRAGGF